MMLHRANALLVSVALLIASIFQLAPSQAFAQAQSANSKISGTILDDKTREKLIGVNVSVQGTKKGARTNVEGKFVVTVEPGSYALRLSAVGYKTKVLEGISVLPGDVKSVDVTLESAAVVGEEVVVTGKLSRESAASQLIERKNAISMNDVLGAEQIRKTPDATSSDAIKRISGVTIVDNKFVSVRGTSERYNNALLNGAAITSTEPDKKAFSFDMLPANLIENTIVSKTFTPDLPANFSGGLVQINTVGIPDQFTARLSIGGSYNSLTQGNEFSTYQTGGSDWLGYDDGTRGLPSGFPATLNDTSIDARELQQYGRMFSNNWAPKRVSAPMNFNWSASIGDAFQLGDEDDSESQIGYIATLSYRTGFDHSNIQRNNYDAEGTALYERTGRKDNRSVLWGGLLNLTYKLSPFNSISLKNTYNQSADDEVIELSGLDSYPSQLFTTMQSFRYIERSVMSNMLTGEHMLPDFGKIKIDWRASRAASTRNEPDLRRFVFGTEDTTMPFYALIGSVPDPKNGGRFFSEMSEQSYEGAADILIPLEGLVASSKLKVGGLKSTKTRDFNARVLAFTLAPGANAMLLFNGIDSIFRPENIGPNAFQIEEIADPTNRYDANEHIAAGYAMVDLPFTALGADLRAVGGVRLEQSIQSLNSGKLGGGEFNYRREYADWLPSASLIWSLNDRMNIRAAATETLTRPEFREIAPFAFYDFELGTLIQGDTNIERARVRNLDIRYEWYPTAGELVSISGFHKRFEGAIEETELGANSIKSWANASKPAINYGVELELRKHLGFITEYLTNLTFTGNYAFIFSKVDVSELTSGLKQERPMQGQSPFTVNVGLLFTEPTHNTSLNVLYNTAGKKIAAVDPFTDDLYEMPRDVIDLSVSQPLAERYELKYSVKDLLAQDQIFKSGDKIERLNEKAPSHSLSLSVRF
ncbi:MAG TPA: TonB-dependent receptor [Candidatus Kapabacteria bacterium]|nr:TonB-dependent receptor [Candidatus Kapabacteria bacterium]